MNYIIPEYYRNFSCKCGECRHSCCDGWPIRISMKEYYQLLGCNCSSSLRARLDCALKLSLSSSQETYAQIATDWQGLCMLHRPDGMCALQAELGEANLPEVCRLYPRHVRRIGNIGECSCSNSCEAVVELLMQMHDPMQFETIVLSINPVFEERLNHYSYDYIGESITIVQNRSMPLEQRFTTLGNLLFGNEVYTGNIDPLSMMFQSISSLLRYYEDSISTHDYCIISQEYFCLNGQDAQYPSIEELELLKKRYRDSSASLDVLLPNWQILFEQLIVNHIFYNHFFLKDNCKGMQDDYVSLVTMYFFLKFNLLGNLSIVNTPDKLVDYLAAMFRVIDHSNFRSVAVKLYQNIFFIDGTSQIICSFTENNLII